MVHTRRLDYSLVDGLLNGEGTADLLEYILQNSPLHPEDIDYFIGKVVELLCSVRSPEKQNEAARILEPVWALVSNTEEIGAERAKRLLIPLLQLGSDSQYGVANLNWIFHIINILLLKVESLDDIFEDSSVTNAIQSLGRTLVDTGDYETQVLIVEAMFHITKHGTHEVWAKNWFPTQCAFDAFMHFDASNFEIECRKLLNNLNEACDKQKVFSVIAQSVIFGELKVQKPPGQELWVNFNFDSKCISFYCVCPSEVEKVQNLKTLWETILIYANNVDSSLLTVFRTHGLQELVIKLNCPCTSLINASSNGLIKGNTIYFLFEEFLEIQAYVAAIFGEMFQNADVPRMKSPDIPCEHNKSQTEGNRKTHHRVCKASEAAAVIHIGQTSNHIGEPSMNMSGCGVIREKLHTEETDGTDVNEDSGCSSSKVSQTAAIIPIGQSVNKVAVPCRRPSDQAAECDTLHIKKEMVDGTVMNEDSGCSSSKVSQTNAIIPIGQSINKIVVQSVRPLDQAAECVTQHSEKAEGTDMNEDSQHSSFKASQTATSIHIGETLNSAEIQNTGVMGNTAENSKCSPLPRNASVNGGSSLSSVPLCKASQSNNYIAIDDVANANKVVRCSTLSTRNHHYVRQMKLNNVIFEQQSSSKSSGSIMNSPMSQDEQPQNLNMGLSESKYSKASFSPVVKILHFPKTPKEATSPVKNKTNETSHEQPLLQTASSEILNAAEVCSQRLLEHGDKAHMQVDGIQVEASEQFKKQSAFVQLPENVNASTAENNINTNSSYEHTKSPTEKNVKLQKDILLERIPVVNLQKEDVNKMKKKTIQKKPEIYLETDILLECNVTEKENNQLCDETAEGRPKKHKLFSNNSRANTELLLNNNTTLIEENGGNATRLAKSTYLKNISKRQNAKRRKLKRKTAPLSSTVQHDNSFIDGEGICSKEPQIQLNDVAKGNQPKEKNTTNLEKAVPLAKLSPEVNFDKSSNSKSGVADSGVGTSVSAEKSSSADEPVAKRLKRKVTNKLDGENKNESGYSGRSSRKAALDSIKKTKKIMKYSEENSSVELGLLDFSDSEDFVPSKTKKTGGSVSKKSVTKSNVYSLTESDANSDHSSSNRRSHVSLFESPVKSYKQW